MALRSKYEFSENVDIFGVLQINVIIIHDPSLLTCCWLVLVCGFIGQLIRLYNNVFWLHTSYGWLNIVIHRLCFGKYRGGGGGGGFFQRGSIRNTLQSFCFIFALEESFLSWARFHDSRVKYSSVTGGARVPKNVRQCKFYVGSRIL